MKYLSQWLAQNSNEERYLFTLKDMRALQPDLSWSAFKALISRAVSSGYLIRICRGIYAREDFIVADGLLLFHVASLLRASEFNYVSLETVLSDIGIISQIPMNWISIMSSGRSNIISCGRFGNIEFIHTDQKPKDLVNELSYDSDCHLWRASVSLALRDMKATHRNCELIDWSIVDEFI